MIWRFTYICYKAKAQQWKESKIETKNEQHKNTWSNNYIVRRVSKIRIERKDEEKSDTFVHVTKWSIQEKYDNKSLPRLWKLREENVDDSQLYMISTWTQWLYIGYIVSVLYISYIMSVLYIGYIVSVLYIGYIVSVLYIGYIMSVLYIGYIVSVLYIGYIVNCFQSYTY